MRAVSLSFFAVACLVSMMAMDVAAILMTLVFVYEFFRSRQKPLFNPSGFDYLFLLWVIVLGVGFYVNSDRDPDWLPQMIEFKWILFFYILTYFFMSLNVKEKIWPWALIVLFICSVYAISIFFLGYDPLQPDMAMTELAGGVRTGGFFSNPMTFAQSYGQVLCWSMGIFLYQWHWKAKIRWWSLLVSLTLAAAVLLSFTRGVWLGIFCGFLFMALLYRRIFSLISVMGISALLFALISFWDGFKERLFYTVDASKNFEIDRLYIWRANIEMWKDHPFLGVGLGENSRLLPDYLKQVGAPFAGLMTHAHNQYIQFLSCTGLLGLLCYLAIIFCFFALGLRVWQRISDRNHWHKGLILGVLGAQVCFFVSGFTESNFEYAKVRYIVLISWAVTVWLAYEYRVLKERFS